MQAPEDLIIETRVEKWHQGHHRFLYCICWWISFGFCSIIYVPLPARIQRVSVGCYF